MLEDLIKAKAADTELRNELQALKRDNERLSVELAQANARRIELERSSKLAETRIAQLTKAVDTALRDAACIDEELTRLRGQNGQLNQSLAPADAAIPGCGEAAYPGRLSVRKPVFDGGWRDRLRAACRS